MPSAPLITFCEQPPASHSRCLITFAGKKRAGTGLFSSFIQAQMIFKCHMGLPARGGGSLASLPLLGHRHKPWAPPAQAVLLVPLLWSLSDAGPCLSSRFNGADDDPELPDAPGADEQPGSVGPDGLWAWATPSRCPGKGQGCWMGKGPMKRSKRVGKGTLPEVLRGAGCPCPAPAQHQPPPGRSQPRSVQALQPLRGSLCPFGPGSASRDDSQAARR